MKDMENTPEPERGQPAKIVLLGIDKKNFYIYDGEDYLDEMLLADGTFPTPVLLLHFEALIETKMVLGNDFSLMDCWAVHPSIVARLRNDGHLVERAAL